MNEIAYVIAYDLPSENYNIFQAPHVKNKVRNTRVNCTYLLHSVGVMCTESVVLAPPRLDVEVARVIDKVNRNYSSLRSQLSQMGISVGIEPLIKVIKVTGEQYDTFRELAMRRLREKIEEAVLRLRRLTDEVHGIEEESRIRQIRSRLNTERREWNNIRELARELGIDLTGDFSRVISLIDEALGAL